MRNRVAVAVILAAVLPALSCTENVVNPTPAATPTPEPTPTPTPTPAPITSPSPEPSSPPEGTTEPAVYATAGVHSYLRKGKLVRSGANTYKPGDTIYLNCTPRDAEGNKTTNHGDIRYWVIFSNDLIVGTDFHYTDTGSFNPDLHIHNPISRASGSVKAQCVVANLPRSNTHNMKVAK
jgi:hypothetical protein